MKRQLKLHEVFGIHLNLLHLLCGTGKPRKDLWGFCLFFTLSCCVVLKLLVDNSLDQNTATKAKNMECAPKKKILLFSLSYTCS